jgi:hypothetical protein
MPSLSYKQRWYAFCGCFVTGGLMSMLSSLSLIKGDIPGFAVFYTLGNIIAIASTCFFWGPKKQLKKMFEKTRAIATTVYLCCIVATLIVACADLGMTDGARTGVCIFLVIFQFAALIWYCLSYFWGGRAAAKSIMGVK